MIGTKLAHYVITQHLGSGGMGDVYQATDSRLDRSVAIKLLPDAFASNSERIARFEREAKVLAALSHANIASIFGLEQVEGRNVLVMELAPGETLAQRMARGPIPLDEALPIALQIADGLEAAHDSGIVHRDLKPANVKVSPDGRVKILDFGLAKMMQEDVRTNLANSPTLLSGATGMGASQPGMIIGTAAYMSPEQTKGKEADRRSDVWAFGCVFFEMLTGKILFEGETVSEVFAGILRGEPDWNALPPQTPAAIRRLLRRCLQRDTKARLHSMGDVRIEILEAQTEPAELPAGVITLPAAPPRSQRLVLASVAILALALVGVSFVAWNASQKKDPAAAVRFEIDSPDGRAFLGSPPRISISPDGRYVVYPVAGGTGEPARLWMRRLDSVDARPIIGTEPGPGENDPQSPFWSPNSRSIGFFVTTGGTGRGNATLGTSKMKRIDIDGGPVKTLCELPSNQGGASWNADGTILVGTLGSGGIFRVPDSGGKPVPVTTLETAKDVHLWPRFLPDGRHFIYQVQRNSERSIVVGSLDSSEHKEILKSDYMAQIVPPNHLLYLEGESLFERPIDLSSFELKGEPLLIAKEIANTTNGRPGFAASHTGVLVYTAGSSVNANARQMAWVERDGKRTPIGSPLTAAGTGGLGGLKLSPDGKRAIFLTNTPSDLWVYDMERLVPTRLTTSSAIESSPIWSPNGSVVVFTSVEDPSKPGPILKMSTNAATPAEVLLPEEPDTRITALDWSTDGKLILFRKAKLGSGIGDLWVLELDGLKFRPYLVTPFNKTRAAFSPDRKWVAYSTDQGSGPPQIFVQPFPDASGNRVQISADGGFNVQWKSDGRELFYISGDGNVVSVPMKMDSGISPGRPSVVFESPFTSQVGGLAAGQLGSGGRGGGGGGGPALNVTADGQRILFFLPAGSPGQRSPITVILNWQSIGKTN